MAKKAKKEDPQQQLINLQAQQLAAQVANWAATLDFQKERFRLLEMPQFQQGLQLDVDKFAWQKGEDTWKRAYQEALVTGTYNGQPTTQWLLDQAKLTGSYNGERTLEGKLTDAQIQDMHDKMKLANDEFVASTTGYFNGQKTFDRDKFEAAQALEGWKFISTLSGPQNAFKQARAIATMPGGQGQLMSAFAGQYMLPSGSAVGSGGAGGSNPAGQLNDMMAGYGGNQAPGGPGGTAPGAAPAVQPPGGMYAQPNNPAVQPPGGMYPQPVAPWPTNSQGGPIFPGSQAAAGYDYAPAGAQAPVGAWNYSGTSTGNVSVYPPGVASPAATPDVSSQQPMNPANVAPVVNQPYQYQAPAEEIGAMLLPNQISARNYANAYQYQRDLAWAGYEDAGWDKSLVQDAFLKSLPSYGGPSKGSVAF